MEKRTRNFSAIGKYNKKSQWKNSKKKIVKNDFSIIYRCLHYFSTNEKLQSHALDCRKINDCAIRLPSVDDKWLEFGNHCNKERIPFIICADLECILRKTKPNREDALSYTYQQHEVFSIGYYVRCAYDTLSSYFYFRRNEGCITWFAQQLNDLAHRVKKIISANVPMKMLSK